MPASVLIGYHDAALTSAVWSGQAAIVNYLLFEATAYKSPKKQRQALQVLNKEIATADQNALRSLARFTYGVDVSRFWTKDLLRAELQRSEPRHEVAVLQRMLDSFQVPEDYEKRKK